MAQQTATDDETTDGEYRRLEDVEHEALKMLDSPIQAAEKEGNYIDEWAVTATHDSTGPSEAPPKNVYLVHQSGAKVRVSGTYHHVHDETYQTFTKEPDEGWNRDFAPHEDENPFESCLEHAVLKAAQFSNAGSF